jgi:hypothetical protein
MFSQKLVTGSREAKIKRREEKRSWGIGKRLA